MTPSPSETVPRHAAAVTLITQLATPLFNKAMSAATDSAAAEVFWGRWESLKRIGMSIAIQRRIHLSPCDEEEIKEAFALLDLFGNAETDRAIVEFNRIVEEERKAAAA